MQEYSYSLDELNSLIPWEREVYLDMLIEHLKQKQEAERQRSMG